MRSRRTPKIPGIGHAIGRKLLADFGDIQTVVLAAQARIACGVYGRPQTPDPLPPQYIDALEAQSKRQVPVVFKRSMSNRWRFLIENRLMRWNRDKSGLRSHTRHQEMAAKRRANFGRLRPPTMAHALQLAHYFSPSGAFDQLPTAASILYNFDRIAHSLQLLRLRDDLKDLPAPDSFRFEPASVRDFGALIDAWGLAHLRPLSEQMLENRRQRALAPSSTNSSSASAGNRGSPTTALSSSAPA